MASALTNEDTYDNESLSGLFDQGFKLHQEIMDSSQDFRSDSFQASVKKATLMLEDATRLVSLMDVFSRNENIKEVPTEHLKYFLLPVLLGDLQAKIYDENEDREETLRVIEIYYKDFLTRCNDYEICEVVVPHEDEDSPPPKLGGRPDLSKMNAERDAKITRFKEQKELENRLNDLKLVLEHPSTDEDLVREFYIKTLKKFVNLCLNELSAFQMEKPLIKHMKLVRAGLAKDPKDEPAKKRPLNPIIITKDQFQKEVFGMGYKNVPILSIEEFYEGRVRDGWFPAPGEAKKAQNSLQNRTEQDQKELEDEEEREKDDKEDRDDEEALARARAMDEYKDDHKRGEGNRHNKG